MLDKVTLEDKLLTELELFWENDLKRISHAKKVLSFAKKILEKEGADWYIAIPASILHDVGIKPSEQKYGSSAGYYQEREGPPVAMAILAKIGLETEYAEEICEIIANHHSPGNINTPNFKVIYDADLIVNLEEMLLENKEKLKELIGNAFLTNSGKELAWKLYVEGDIQEE